jgi:hypothetical protein
MRTGVTPRDSSTRAPGGSATVRRPSQSSTAGGPVGSTSIATSLSGEITIGRANRACALLGTSSSASTWGQTSGPPAENA